MKTLSLFTDVYERKARLYPALVCIAPLAAVAVAVISVSPSLLETVAAFTVATGGTFLLSQLGRDAGKEGEKKLFESWGGMPSVAVFRHRDMRINPIIKERCHKNLASLVKGTKAPTPAQEQSEPAAADQIYTAWSTHLRTHTRDTKKYDLLFQENVNYGYRRNLWGLRPYGIVISAIGILAAGGFVLYRFYRSNSTWDTGSAFACAVSAVFLLLWFFRFTPKWVRLAADAYAERLAEAAYTLASTSRGEKKSKKIAQLPR